MASLQIKRGTRSQLDTAASANQLKVGELYLITDEDRLAVGTATNAYSEAPIIGDIITETIIVHLSDNVTPVAPGTSIELLTLRYNFTITGVWFESPFQPPSGSAAIARVLFNGTNIFTNADALTIPADSTSVGALVPNTTFLANGGVLRFDIQQVGATNTGRGYRVTLQGTRS